MRHNEGRAQTTGGEHISPFVETPTEEVLPTAKPERRRYHLDARLEKEICNFAKKHGLKKVILFGSRARGTNCDRSDIDLAVSGGDCRNFSFDVDEETNTLLRFDVVNLDEHISEELQAEIDRDGIAIYEEGRYPLMKKYENYAKCLEVLKNSGREEAAANEIYRMGIVGQFNLTFELAWKALQEVLRLHGAAKTGSPREIFKTAYSVGFLPDDKIWLDMLEKRNTATHVYKEEEAEKIAALVFDKYISAFAELSAIIREKLAEVQEGKSDA